MVGQDPVDSRDVSCRHWQAEATTGLGTTWGCEGTGARHEQLGVDVDKESWELLEYIIEAVALHRAIGIVDLLLRAC